MTSHELASELRLLSDYLQSKVEFEIGDKPSLLLFYWQDKEKFLAAVKALGTGKKTYQDHLSGDVIFTPTTPSQIDLDLHINRSAVCRKVQEEVWDCEPLLSAAEEAEVGL